VTWITLYDLRNGYVRLASWLVETGLPVDESRGGGTLERTGVTIDVPDPTGVMLPLGVNRKINAKLAAVEALQLMSGTGDVELLRRASPNYTEVLVDPAAAAYGAYGPRLRSQLEEVYRELLRNPASRRAVLAIWQPDDLFHDGDRPCTLSLHFLLRAGRLELHVTMRSQDLWLGVPYDLFMFTQLQLSLARQLGVAVGRYVHHVGSLHVYRRNIEAVGMLTRVPEDHPRPADYPAGVIPVAPEDTFTDVARYLVEGGVDQGEVEANVWYARMLIGLVKA
jgi:thymidylate synthase